MNPAFIRGLIAAIIVFVACPATLTLRSSAQDFKKEVIYQIVTDRFFDGNPANNDPPQSFGMYDSTRSNWRAYWGGDLDGIRQKLSYLQGLGVTAIWISPPLDNRNVATFSGAGPVAPYHGYEARDLQAIEEHFGDSMNSWAAFDNLVAAAHAPGIDIKIIVDFAPNHSNVRTAAEFGALHSGATFLASYNNDPNGIFLHNPNIFGGQWNDRYFLQYHTLFDLADLNQAHPTVDFALKQSIATFQAHGADGFRIDATKHANWGWQYSMANAAFTNQPTFFFGEWVNDSTSDPLYPDFYKFSNKSGISALNFPLYNALTNVFAWNQSFTQIESVLATETATFAFLNDQVSFVDNHDRARFLSLLNNHNRLHQALAFVLTCRGIPCIYYGTEQYLHNDTDGGGDPYNRPMMAGWDTTTTAYQLIGRLSALRQDNPALAYGGMGQRWINDDIYIYERRFGENVVVVAINKSHTTSQLVTGLYTNLPPVPGGYTDYLGGLLGGVSITPTSTNNGTGYAVNAFDLPAHSVSVWTRTVAATGPIIGSLGPTSAQPGVPVTLAGAGFGPSTGTVAIGGINATVNSWSDTNIVFTVPPVGDGLHDVSVTPASGGATTLFSSTGNLFTVLQAKLIPVTITVQNATTNWGEQIHLTGDTVELGNWSTSFEGTAGPFLTPNYPSWFLTVGLPAGKVVEFKFIKIRTDGSFAGWEPGAGNHTYTVPSSGTGFVNVTWGAF